MRTIPAVAALALLFFTSGCGSSASAKGCQRDEDCGGGGAVCQAGVCDGGQAVRIVIPAGKVYTNSRSALLLSVGVTLAAARRVQLWVDDAELAELASPPFDYTWDTSSLSEGTHHVDARVSLGGRVYRSDPVEVIVDRTSPTVVDGSRVPAPGAVNVWSRDPITVTFSEPIALPASDAVELVGVSGGAIFKDLSLSEDGRTLTVSPRFLPAVPDTLQLTLTAGVTDLAGNALTQPDGRWTWDLPQWQEVAPSRLLHSRDLILVFITTALGPDGAVYATWQTWPDSHMGGDPPIVLKAAGGTWTDTTPAPLLGSSWLARLGCALVVDPSSHPIVAYMQFDAYGSDQSVRIHVARHDGSTWVPLGDALNASQTGDASSPRMVLDAEGYPIVAWRQAVGDDHRVLVARWDGATWQPSGEVAPGGEGDLTTFDLATGPQGALSIAYVEGSSLGLARFDAASGTWQCDSPLYPRPAVGPLSLAFDGSGTEVVAYTEERGVVRVVRRGTAPLWFVDLGASLAGDHPSVCYRPSAIADQRLVVAFLEAGPRVVGWNGTAWVSMAEEIGTPSSSLYFIGGQGLGVNAEGVLSYAWAVEDTYWTVRLYLERFNR